MITSTMNKEEILKEARKWFKFQEEVIGKKCDKVYNKARIKYRKTRAPVYVGTFPYTYNSTTYYTSTMMNFPLGTRNKSEYYTLLLYTYTILVLPSSGKKKALYINPNFGDEKVNMYGTHFLRRFYERMTGLSSEGKSFEWLAEFFFKGRGPGSTSMIFQNARYKDYPGPFVVSRLLNGLELGWKDEMTGILHLNTFITDDMFHNTQEEMFGDDSEIMKILEENISLVPNFAPLPTNL